LIKTFRAILFPVILVPLMGDLAPLNAPASPATRDSTLTMDETKNRLPEILGDAKNLLSEAVISDFHKDTLEVHAILSRIFELLIEADQIGEMNREDEEEFQRFNDAFTDLYNHKLTTIQQFDAPVMAEKVRHTIMEHFEIEMGDTKFVVVDDRDGHIPLVRTKQVDQYIKYFTTKGRKQFQIWLKRYVEYKDIILPILKEHEMPEELIYLAMIGLNPKAYSRANASGMWQFIYATGKRYGLSRDWYRDERRDPVKATHAACKYLKDLNNLFDNWYLTLAAYNCGEGRVLRASRLHQTYDFWQLHSLPKETRNYIPYFLSAAIIAQTPEAYGFTIPKAEPLKYEVVTLEKSADLAVLARVIGIKGKTLRKYNPELRQSATPADAPYQLKIPPEKKEHFLSTWSSIPENERFAPQFVIHRVKYGESLWTIASKYGVSIHDLASVNKIRNRHKIRVGQKMKVPVRGSGRVWGTLGNGGPSGHTKRLYKVKRGDTLGQIAEDFGTRASKIRRWNNMKYGSHLIHPGQRLIIWVKEG